MLDPDFIHPLREAARIAYNLREHLSADELQSVLIALTQVGSFKEAAAADAALMHLREADAAQLKLQQLLASVPYEQRRADAGKDGAA